MGLEVTQVTKHEEVTNGLYYLECPWECFVTIQTHLASCASRRMIRDALREECPGYVIVGLIVDAPTIRFFRIPQSVVAELARQGVCALLPYTSSMSSAQTRFVLKTGLDAPRDVCAETIQL